MSRLSVGILAVLFVVVPRTCVRADDEPSPSMTGDSALRDVLEPIRLGRNVPGIVAGIVRGDRLSIVAAVGVRKAGSDVPITINDQLHIGSCTKAMTATLLARLIERGALRFDSTIGDVFADRKAELHADYLGVTLEQLLTHRGGLPANGPWHDLGKGSVVEQRETLLRTILAKPPMHAPGSAFHYSNVGYALAGHMAEEVTGKEWETLIQEELFVPLAMKSAGFGPPGTKNQIDQPWGHQPFLGTVIPRQEDNAPSLGPAGTVHCTLEDWGRFASLQMHGTVNGKPLLTAESMSRLRTPPSEPPGYAGGWIIEARDWGGGKVLTHDGSNTMWHASIWVAPERDMALLAVVNAGGDAATRACHEAIRALLDRVRSDASAGNR